MLRSVKPVQDEAAAGMHFEVRNYSFKCSRCDWKGITSRIILLKKLPGSEVEVSPHFQAREAYDEMQRMHACQCRGCMGILERE